MENPYKVLGLMATCSEKEVHVGFQNKINPYLNRNLDNGEKQIVKKYKNAYKILGNYHNRRKFDNEQEGITTTKKFNEIKIKKTPEFNYEKNGINYGSTLMRPFENNFGFPKIDLDLENQFRMSESTFKTSLRDEQNMKKSNDDTKYTMNNSFLLQY